MAAPLGVPADHVIATRPRSPTAHAARCRCCHRRACCLARDAAPRPRRTGRALLGSVAMLSLPAPDGVDAEPQRAVDRAATARVAIRRTAGLAADARRLLSRIAVEALPRSEATLTRRRGAGRRIDDRLRSAARRGLAVLAATTRRPRAGQPLDPRHDRSHPRRCRPCSSSLHGAIAQTPQPSFSLLGYIQQLDVDDLNDPLSKGRVRVNGIDVTLPKNLLITMPGQYLTVERSVPRASSPTPATPAVKPSGLALGRHTAAACAVRDPAHRQHRRRRVHRRCRQGRAAGLERRIQVSSAPSTMPRADCSSARPPARPSPACA